MPYFNIHVLFIILCCFIFHWYTGCAPTCGKYNFPSITDNSRWNAHKSQCVLWENNYKVFCVKSSDFQLWPVFPDNFPFHLCVFSPIFRSYLMTSSCNHVVIGFSAHTSSWQHGFMSAWLVNFSITGKLTLFQKLSLTLKVKSFLPLREKCFHLYFSFEVVFLASWRDYDLDIWITGTTDILSL